MSEKTSEKTSEKIIKLIKKNSQITFCGMVEKIAVSQCSIVRNLKKLQSENRLMWVGADKGVSWKVFEK